MCYCYVCLVWKNEAWPRGSKPWGHCGEDLVLQAPAAPTAPSPILQRPRMLCKTWPKSFHFFKGILFFGTKVCSVSTWRDGVPWVGWGALSALTPSSQKSVPWRPFKAPRSKALSIKFQWKSVAFLFFITYTFFTKKMQAQILNKRCEKTDFFGTQDLSKGNHSLADSSLQKKTQRHF